MRDQLTRWMTRLELSPADAAILKAMAEEQRSDHLATVIGLAHYPPRMTDTPVQPHIFASFGDVKRLEVTLARIEGKLDQVLGLEHSILKGERALTTALDDLENAVAAEDTVIGATLKLLDDLAVKIANAGTDPARLQALTTDIMNRRDALAAAVAKGTSADGESPPAPPAAGPTISTISPVSGAAAGGESVVITGTGLTGATKVAFGGTDSPSFTVDSDSQITAISPALTGEFDITVDTPAGHVSSAPTTFTFA